MENREEMHLSLTILQVREHGKEAGVNGVFQTWLAKPYLDTFFV